MVRWFLIAALAVSGAVPGTAPGLEAQEMPPMASYAGSRIGFDYPRDWGRAAVEYAGLCLYAFSPAEELRRSDPPSLEDLGSLVYPGEPVILLCLLPEDLEDAFDGFLACGGVLEEVIRSEEVSHDGTGGRIIVSRRRHPDAGDVVEYALLTRTPVSGRGSGTAAFLIGICPQEDSEGSLALFDAVRRSIRLDLHKWKALGRTERYEGFRFAVEYPKGWGRIVIEATGVTALFFTSARPEWDDALSMDLGEMMGRGDAGFLFVFPEEIAREQGWTDTALDDPDGVFRQMFSDCASGSLLVDSGPAMIGGMEGRSATYRVTDDKGVERIVIQALSRQSAGSWVFFMGSTRMDSQDRNLRLFERMRGSFSYTR